MEIREDPTFTSLFAQVQVLEMVVMAMVKAHPQPAELLEQLEQQLEVLRSLSSARATDLLGRLAHSKLDQKVQGWLDYARQELPTE